ncbi:pilus assembly protein FimT [Noviherbaspirillum saxi]|uniref:Type II secretion system protein H n=1 Tax=Noviherbaspirillum saxi TaxID=2320863 RepID=A0A3A3FZH8_9BURK|nr:pilus assembly protein FimT [Noviherbaspirillum saxi]
MVELLTVLAVMAILLGIAAPSFGELIQSQKASSTVNDFLSSIQLARSEAIRRGVRVDLVPSGENWSAGWTVFVDEDNDQKPGPGEQVIFTHPSAPPDMVITSVLTDQSPLYLAYAATGRTRTNHAGGQQPQFGSFTFELGKQKRKIVLNALGRPRVCTPKAGEDNC